VTAPPFVSVTLPTWNRAGLIETCLESLLRQDYPKDRYEIIVVDDGSEDDTRRVVEAVVRRILLPAAQYVWHAHAGLNSARNTALRVAVGDPICFVDDDQVMPSSWLTALAEGAERHPEAGCLGGPIRLRYEGTPPRMCAGERLGETELDHGGRVCEVPYVWGGNMALRRRAVERVGGFREDLVMGGTETEWQDRLRAAGEPVVYLPEAYLWHRLTEADLRLHRLMLNRFFRGRGLALNARRVGTPLEAGRFVRALLEALRHGVRNRCSVGLIQAAQHAGRLLGIAEGRLSSFR
jgi:GT2 family glycosyltransferase